MTTLIVVSIFLAPVLGLWFGYAALAFDLARGLLDEYKDKVQYHKVLLIPKSPRLRIPHRNTYRRKPRRRL
jgi:phosphate/sulfate permease